MESVSFATGDAAQRACICVVHILQHDRGVHKTRLTGGTVIVKRQMDALTLLWLTIREHVLMPAEREALST